MKQVLVDPKGSVASVSPLTTISLIRSTPEGSYYAVPDNVSVAPGMMFDGSANTFKPKTASKLEYARLFTVEEEQKVNALRKTVAALTPADYQSADPAIKNLCIMEVVIARFDRATIIELKHPETAQGLHALASAGIFGANAAARIARITDGLPPEPPAPATV